MSLAAVLFQPLWRRERDQYSRVSVLAELSCGVSVISVERLHTEGLERVNRELSGQRCSCGRRNQGIHYGASAADGLEE